MNLIELLVNGFFEVKTRKLDISDVVKSLERSDGLVTVDYLDYYKKEQRNDRYFGSSFYGEFLTKEAAKIIKERFLEVNKGSININHFAHTFKNSYVTVPRDKINNSIVIELLQPLTSQNNGMNQESTQEVTRTMRILYTAKSDLSF